MTSLGYSSYRAHSWSGTDERAQRRRTKIYSRRSRFCKLKNFDLYLTMKVPEAAVNQLVRQLENNKIISISVANNVRRCNKLFEKWNILLDVLVMSEDDSYHAFFDSLRSLNHDNLARILEEGEAVVQVKVSNKSIPSLEKAEKRFIKVLNFVTQFNGQIKGSIAKLMNQLSSVDCRILEATSDTRSGLIFWIWCRSSKGVLQLEKLKESRYLHYFFINLYTKLRVNTLEPVDVFVETKELRLRNGYDFASLGTECNVILIKDADGSYFWDLSLRSLNSENPSTISRLQQDCFTAGHELTSRAVGPCEEDIDGVFGTTSIGANESRPKPTGVTGVSREESSKRKFTCQECFNPLLQMNHTRCPECRTKVHQSWLEGRHSKHEVQMDSDIESAEELVGVPEIPIQCGLESPKKVVNAPEIPDLYGIELPEEQIKAPAIPTPCGIESAEELIKAPEIPDPYVIEFAKVQIMEIEGSCYSGPMLNRVSSEADEGSCLFSSPSFVGAESDSANEESSGELTLEQ